MEIRIGENIKRLRNENRVTQEQLAACVMKGKLLFVKGKKQEAIDLYKYSLPDWYQTSGQKIEQLCKQLKSLTAFLPKDKIDQLISGFASDFELKLRVLAGANEETLTKIREYII